MAAYYNEFDTKAAAWLRELIRAGLIPDGDVDERSICEVRPHELVRYTQQHFFAGIGGWAYALRLAGWPDDRPIRTGSCPCQPFSAAGKGLGEKDARHLWPVFRDLIAFGEPTTTFGEQVASAAGRIWLSRVRADMEGLGYGVGAADLCAASVGAPQRRQRLYWVANPMRCGRCKRTQQHGASKQVAANGHSQGGYTNGCGGSARLADTTGKGREGGVQEPHKGRPGFKQRGHAAWMGNAHEQGPQGRRVDGHGASEWAPWSANVGVCGNDGTWRRVEPSIPPVAARIPSRVALIRGSGNAIVPQLAAEFIQSCEETGCLI